MYLNWLGSLHLVSDTAGKLTLRKEFAGRYGFPELMMVVVTFKARSA